jgi:pimeloyl-ACP methyl ester carboxylesterase
MMRVIVVGLAALLLAAPAMAQTRFVATVTGQGPDVVLIPGLASSDDVWDATVKQLSATHRVHALQVKGFAGEPSGSNADGPILAPLIEEVAAYAAKLDKPAIIGHSLGGLTALEVAARHPDSVDRVMIVDALPFYALLFAPTATVEMVKPQAEMMRTQAIGMTDEQFAAGQDRTMAMLVKTEASRAAPKEWSLKSDRKVVATAMYEDMIEDARPLLPQIKARSTIVYAYDAQMGRPTEFVDSMYTKAYEGLAGAKLKRIDGSFHFVMLDQPEAFAKEVEAFLK